MTEKGQVFGGEEHLDASRDPWLTANEAGPFQGQDHLVHGRRSELEMALHVGLRRGAAMDAGIGVDEGQVLALPVGEAFRRTLLQDRFIGASHAERQNEHTLSG